MKKRHSILLLAILVTSCAGPELETVDSVVSPPTQQVIITSPPTPITASVFTQTPINTPLPASVSETRTSTPHPTSVSESPTSTPNIPTETLAAVAGYCDYEAAMVLVSRIDELTKASSGGSDQAASDEQTQLILAAIDEKILEVDHMSVPGCLAKSIEYLRASYVSLRDMFSGIGGVDVLFRLSEEQRLFDEEYARVKACIPTGCQ